MRPGTTLPPSKALLRRGFFCFNSCVRNLLPASLLLFASLSFSTEAAPPASADTARPSADTSLADSLPAPASAVPAASAASAPKETCREILERVRKSDCAKPVARFMDGASVILGLALNSSEMEISYGDTLMAAMVGILSPSPYFGFSGPKSYFGKSRWGYEFSLAYTSSIAIYQDLSKDREAIKDLGTYATMTFLSLSPSLFLSIGARDEDPDIWWRYGIGLGAGWASVRGVAYHTQDPGGEQQGACRDAAVQLRNGDITRTDLRAVCDLQSFHESGLGISSAAFMDFRWRYLYGKISSGGLQLASDPYDFFPIEISIKFAYIHDI